jgi:hypothetical protein
MVSSVVERLPYKQMVTGSNPVPSITKLLKSKLGMPFLHCLKKEYLDNAIITNLDNLYFLMFYISFYQLLKDHVI